MIIGGIETITNKKVMIRMVFVIRARFRSLLCKFNLCWVFVQAAMKIIKILVTMSRDKGAIYPK